MFTRIGHLAVRRRRTVLFLSLAGVLVAGFFGGGVFAQLSAGGFNDPASESSQAADELEERFGTGQPNVVLLVTATDGSVDDPAVIETGIEITEDLAAVEGTDDVVSYWTLGGPDSLRSDDGAAALILARLPGDADEFDDVIEEIAIEFEGARGPVQVEIGGSTEVFRQVGETIEGDLTRAELIAVPITLVLLVLVFGGVVAAALPLAVGLVAIPGAFFVLWAITQATSVSVFSINLVTALGLGLAIDYSLFIVSRFREELRAGRDVEAAVVRTVETAGRTIAFSGLTTSVSLAALLIFPLFFLRSFAYAGIGVILVAMVTSVISLPALLAMLGRRVDSLQLWRRKPVQPGEGIWHRIAVAVMRRPLPIATAIVALLLVLGLPFLQVSFGVPDDRVLPEDNSARVVQDTLREDFASDEANAFPIVATGITDPADVDAYATAVADVDGVGRVDVRGVDGDAAWFNVVPSVEPISPEAEDMVADIREIDTTFETAVAGTSAELVDSKDAIFSRVPLAAGIIAVATFVLLFLMTGSVVMPIKAIVLNLLSLTATFGAIVWIFQEGNGAGLLDFTATGLTDTTIPILMFCIAFGLSMDYEVFLISRIKEEYDRTGENEQSVAVGLERTGRIVTAAALILSVTFLAFATSNVTFIKLFGLGLAIAVLMDAFLIRATLVPAFMKLAGKANWWSPAPLARLHERIGISDAEPPEPQEPSDQERTPALTGSH